MTLTSIPWSKGAGLSGETEHSLAERAAAGDRQAFAHIVRVHQAYISRLAHRLLGWDPEVEDVVQDVFARAWQHRRQLRASDKLRGWLASITVNTARDRLRKRKLRRAWLMTFNHRPHESPDRPDHEMQREELGRRVREAVNALPQRDKEVLVLYYLEHMPVSEVAGTIGISTAAVTGRLHRARQRLAQRLPGELTP